MNLIFRYLSIQFSKWLLRFSAFILFVLFLFDFLELLRRGASKPQVTLITTVKMSLIKIPTLFLQVTPFVILFSAMITFWFLNRHHEWTIFRSLGLSIWRLIRPMFACVAVWCLAEALILNPLAASLMLKFEHLEDRYFHGHQGSLAVSDSGLWLRDVTHDIQTVYHIGRVDQDQKKLFDVTLYRTTKEDVFMDRYDAKEAVMHDDGMLVLNQVHVTYPGALPLEEETVTLPTRISFRNILNSGANPSSLSFWHLQAYSRLLEHSGLSFHRYLIHWHGTLSKWVWLAVMVLVAALCSLRSVRERKTTPWILMGLTVAFFLYIFRDISMAMGLSLKIPVAVATWTPTLISGLLSLVLLLHLEDG